MAGTTVLPGQEDPFYSLDLIQSGIDLHQGTVGIAIGDLNNDLREDLYFSRRGGPNVLYVNNGQLSFYNVPLPDIETASPQSRTGLWADLDNDGFQDIIGSTMDDYSYILWNNEGRSFTKETLNIGAARTSNTFSINLFDMDGNGYLDILTSNFLQENEFWINDGERVFFNQAFRYQMDDPSLSMGNICYDIDSDGDQDVILIHDGFQEHHIMINQGSDQPFALADFQGLSNINGQGMGADIADINNDGLMDIYITNLYENNLLLNLGNNEYEDIAATAGVDDQGMGWGVSFLDFNNDGWVDIYVSNDSHFSPFPNVLYENQGDLTFVKVEQSTVNSMNGGYGNAAVDLNMDGSLDIIQANLGTNDVPEIFINKGNDSNWFGIKLKGTLSNSDAIGSKVLLLDGSGGIHFDEVTGGNGFAAQSSPIVHFGLGQEQTIQRLEITWPSGHKDIFEELRSNKYYLLEEGSGVLELFDQTTSVDNEFVQLNFEIFPNPVEDFFFLKSDTPFDNQEITGIMDMQGRHLYLPFNKKSNQNRIDVSFLEKGLYFLGIRNGKEIQYFKFIKI